MLDMDGWGSKPKKPYIDGDPYESINRMYLKLKAQLMPYLYTYAIDSVDGLPMIRAMFLEEENEYTYSTATQYQFMYGDSFLVAPIYQDTAMDENGNDIVFEGGIFAAIKFRDEELTPATSTFTLICAPVSTIWLYSIRSGSPTFAARLR